MLLLNYKMSATFDDTDDSSNITNAVLDNAPKRRFAKSTSDLNMLTSNESLPLASVESVKVNPTCNENVPRRSIINANSASVEIESVPNTNQMSSKEKKYPIVSIFESENNVSCPPASLEIGKASSLRKESADTYNEMGSSKLSEEISSTSSPRGSEPRKSRRAITNVQRIKIPEYPKLKSSPISAPTEKDYSFLGLGTPTFHRKMDYNIPKTPIISHSTKRSWFASIFNFKNETIELLLESDIQDAVVKVCAGLEVHIYNTGFKSKA
jgi:hypothetical protein